MNIFRMSMFNLPNLLTAMNLLCGVTAIICSFAGRIDLAPFLIFTAAIFDFLDGFVARKLKIAGDLGKQLDSLADVVTFGVAPGVMMLVVMVATIYIDGPFFTNDFCSHVHYQLQNWMNAVFYGVPNSMDDPIKFVPFSALFIPFMSMFRLAKFNIDIRQTDSFIGLPTPMNAFFFTFFPLILWLDYANWKYDEGMFVYLFNTYTLLAIIVIMSFLLISELPLLSMKFKHFGWKGNEIRFLLLITSVFLVVFFHVWSIPLIVILYLTLSLFEYSRNKNKTT